MQNNKDLQELQELLLEIKFDLTIFSYPTKDKNIKTSISIFPKDTEIFSAFCKNITLNFEGNINVSSPVQEQTEYYEFSYSYFPHKNTYKTYLQIEIYDQDPIIIGFITDISKNYTDLYVLDVYLTKQKKTIVKFSI